MERDKRRSKDSVVCGLSQAACTSANEFLDRLTTGVFREKLVSILAETGVRVFVVVCRVAIVFLAHHVHFSIASSALGCVP